MADLACEYMSLSIKSPVVIASSPLTGTLEGLKRCEQAGAGAVVLKSIFEEQIDKTVEVEANENASYLEHSDFASYFENVSKDYYLNQYLTLLKNAKKELSIPVIASINCHDSSTWMEYISSFESVGADGIELNYYPIAAESDVEGKEVDKALFAFAKRARKATRLPLSLKIGYKYSSLANVISQLSDIGIDSIVLFNRFFRPDIDVEKMELIKSEHILSSKGDYTEALRWVALMSAEVKSDLAAATGIHDGETVTKLLLAGAACAQVCSAAIKDISVVKEMNDYLSSWMDRHGFASIEAFKGKLAQERMADGSAWERTQYMKTLIYGSGK